MPTVLVTRPEQQTEPLKSDLERLGFDVLLQPTIEILPPENWVEVDDAIRRLIGPDEKNSFDWLVFFSTNGVDFFFNRIETIREEVYDEEDFDPEKTRFGASPSLVEFLRPVRLAVVGNMTEHTLTRRVGRRADVLPDTFTAEDVVENLLDEARQGKRFLVLRANRGRDVIRRRLTEAGGIVAEIVVYRSVDVKTPDPDLVRAMHNGEIEYATVTSSAIARSLVRLFGDALRRTKLVSISPITSQTLEEIGFPPSYEAGEASMRGIAEVFVQMEYSG